MTNLIFVPPSGPGARIPADPTAATGSPLKHIPADAVQAGLGAGGQIAADPTVAATQTVTVL